MELGRAQFRHGILYLLRRTVDLPRLGSSIVAKNSTERADNGDSHLLANTDALVGGGNRRVEIAAQPVRVSFKRISKGQGELLAQAAGKPTAIVAMTQGFVRVAEQPFRVALEPVSMRTLVVGDAVKIFFLVILDRLSQMLATFNRVSEIQVRQSLFEMRTDQVTRIFHLLGYFEHRVSKNS